MIKKECSKCLLDKEIINFNKDKYQKSGFRPECKDCAKKYRSSKKHERAAYDKKRYYENYDLMQQKNKSYRLNNPEKIKKYYSDRPEYKSYIQKKYRFNNREKLLLSYAKRRAKKRNLEFNIDISDIVIPKICPILGIELCINQSLKFGETGKSNYNSPSLDRINPSKGYIKGNIRVISCRANLLKNNASEEELQLILEDIKKWKIKE